VLACVPVLATGQEQIATGQEQIATGQEQIATGQEQIADGTAVVVTPESRSVSRRHGSVGLTLRRTALGIAAIASLLVSVLVGAGLLYGLRGLGWLAAGPGIRDALPLLQLPGFDGQPLARVLVAFLAGGAVFGATLIRTAPTRRAAVAGVAGLLVLLVASDAAFAVTHNLRFGPILWQRAPTIGCWVQALALAIGAAIPRSPASLRVPRRNRVSGSPIAIPGKPA
jgi:hypothetical protein